MRVRVGDLRRVIREEFMRGVPDWALRQATKDYVEVVRGHVKRFILQNKSEDHNAQRQAIAIANEVLEELEDELFDKLEDKLYQFTRRV